MEQFNFLISIIVPCYNAEYYLKDVIKSIQNQTYRNMECIVINDGSTDKTMEILDTVTDERFRIFSQENKGLSDTRNFGLERASGDFVFFCDSDDLLPLDALENLLKAYDDEDIIIGKTSTYQWKNKEKISPLPHFKQKITLKNENAEVLIINMTKGLTPIAQNKLYKTPFLKENKLKFFSGIYHEDELWFFETMFKAKKVTFIPEITYLYTVDNEQSITKKKNDKNLLGYLKVVETIYEKYYILYPEKSITSYYIPYLKKLIIGNYRESGYSNEGVYEMEKIFKKVSPEFNNNIELKDIEKKYFQYIDRISLCNAEEMKKKYFNSPVNSLRKHLKILLFTLFNVI